MRFPWLSLCVLGLGCHVAAMSLSGTHDPDVHDVYASGYPANPARNASALFVGKDRAPVSAAWSASGPTKSFVLITPKHYLSTRHFGGAPTLKVFGADDQLHSRDQWKTENTLLGVVFDGQTTGDLSVGTLQRAFPLTALPRRLGVLDLHDDSATNDPFAYNGLTLHVFGRDPDSVGSPRLAESSISSTTMDGNSHRITFSRNIVKLQSGDSGSPTFAAWTNPNGDPEHAIIGNHAAIDTENGFNIDNFAASKEVMQSLNGFLVDEGRALRVVGNPSLNWSGVDSTLITDSKAWGYRGPPPPEDRYVRFHGDQAGNDRVVTVDSAFEVRGLYFTLTGSSSLGFTFEGGGVLEVGRGGLTNYDQSPQTFTVPVRLVHDQYWDVGPGGVLLGDVDTNGYHLEWGGVGVTTVSGAITGGGSVAVDQGTWIFNGSAGYTGPTWIHQARAEIHADLSSSPLLWLGENGILSGTGVVSTVQGGGTLSPGPGPAILTAASLSAEPGLTLDLSFTAAQPDFSSPASSGNDVFRLTAPTPFAAPLADTHTIRVFLDTGADPVHGDSFTGGLFTDVDGDFIDEVANANLETYTPDPEGSILFGGQTYSLHNAEGEWVASTIEQTADFGDGAVPGRVLRLRFLPPTGTYARWTYEAFPEEVDMALREPDVIPNEQQIPNFASYAFGLDPMNPNPALLPRGEATTSEFVLFYRMRTGASEVDYRFDTATDLTGEWTEKTLSSEVVDPDPDGDGGVALMKVTRPVGAETILFLRVRTPLLF